MPTWQVHRQRIQGYLRPWPIIKEGISLFIQARPVCLGGTSIPAGVSTRDHVSGQVFRKLAAGFKAFEGSSTAVPTLVASAYGTVLEVGPGVGTQIDRFDESKIDHIYGVELNTALIPTLVAEVQRAGLQDKYTVIPGSVNDATLLGKFGVKIGTIDSIVCIGSLCSIENPRQTIRGLYNLLKPGGTLILWEHRRSTDDLTILVQYLWNPIWRVIMGGCSLTCPMEDIILNAGRWDLARSDIINTRDAVAEWSIMPRFEGKLVKEQL